MSPEDHVNLMKQMEPHRYQKTEVDGVSIPSSVAILTAMLASIKNPLERRDIYHHIIFECQITDSRNLELQHAKNEHEEFCDMVTAMQYSSALISNDRFDDGIAMARWALNEAIEQKELINCAAAGYVREAIRVGRIEDVNSAISALMSSLPKPRAADFVLELEWLPKAEALGADPLLVANLRPMYKAPGSRRSR